MDLVQYLEDNNLLGNAVVAKSDDPKRIEKANNLYRKLMSDQEKFWEKYEQQKQRDHTEAMIAAGETYIRN